MKAQTTRPQTFLTTKQCSRCRAWSDCAGKEFYPTGDICYCRYQCLWLIAEFLDTVGDDITFIRATWPPDTYESGYTEAEPTQHSISPRAPYEVVMGIIGELDHRLARTGPSGRSLINEVRKTVAGRQHIAEGLYHLRLTGEASWALGYVNGARRKRQSFVNWKADKMRQSREAGKTIKNMVSVNGQAPKPLAVVPALDKNATGSIIKIELPLRPGGLRP